MGEERGERACRPKSTPAYKLAAETHHHLLLAYGLGIVEHGRGEHRVRDFLLQPHAERFKAMAGARLIQRSHSPNHPWHHGLNHIGALLVERTRLDGIVGQRDHGLEQKLIGHRVAVGQHQSLGVHLLLGGEIAGDMLREVVVDHKVAYPQGQIAIDGRLGATVVVAHLLQQLECLLCILATYLHQQLIDVDKQIGQRHGGCLALAEHEAYGEIASQLLHGHITIGGIISVKRHNVGMVLVVGHHLCLIIEGAVAGDGPVLMQYLVIELQDARRGSCDNAAQGVAAMQRGVCWQRRLLGRHIIPAAPTRAASEVVGIGKQRLVVVGFV